MFDTSYSPKGVNGYQIWQNAKKLGGYFVNNELAGVGFTVPTDNKTIANSIWSAEWTWGAVFMARKLAMEYDRAGRNDLANNLRTDMWNMVKHLQQPMKLDKENIWMGGGMRGTDGGYLYANKRFFIPWGWYANPLEATSSTAWAVLWDFGFNPFELGGGFNTTFYSTQCANNPPDKDVLAKLAKYYDYAPTH